ncbi:MAG TPA: integrase core domain-containing protein, partial [Thermoanaerobaculia bacterium]|nr:integrase core domain-containing protein [Thermoanaerobaculia bacterium]
MALRVRTIVEQRLAAMELIAAGSGVGEVAERLGVSRQAVYDWQARYREDPETGLNDRSRRPHTSPTRTAAAIEQRVIEERKRWGFGSKKILRRLQDQEPDVAWPPRSTIDAIFKRADLVHGRRKAVRGRFAPVEAKRTYDDSTAPGEVMTADYKGQFRLRNGRYCYPLLVADPVSRYLLACDAFTGISLEQTWASFVRVFREHGLPNMLHTDNGVPFGTSGHGRFSTISVRLMKYGIQPVYSRPGRPEDNARHERLNRTLLECTTIDPAHDNAGQQVLFDAFRRMFNHERPHESLNQDRPAARHRASPRSFPDRVPVVEYEPHFETKFVDAKGRMYWLGERIYFSDAFASERIGFERIDYSSWRVHYGSFVIGRFGDA